MHRYPHALCAALLAIIVTVPALADTPTPVRYDGYAAVRTWPDSAAELATVQSLDLVLMSDGEGIGQVDYLVAPEKLPGLAASGVHYEIMHPNVQAVYDAERARLAAAGDVDPRSRGWFDDYKTYDQIVAFLDALVTDYPDLVTKEQIGTSWEGRPIWAITVTSPVGGNKPALSFNAMAHAREWVGPTTVLYIVDRLVRNYNADPEIRAILDELVLYVCPTMNPDGYIYSWNYNRQWRKTRRPNGDGTYGVDWNRNFSVGWGGPGASSDPGSLVYHGTAPFSEPETQALRDFILAHPDIAAHIDFHSYSQLILRPYGYDYIEAPGPDGTLHQQLGDDMADAIYSVHGKTYTSTPAYDLYLASGICSDWAYEEGGALAWTIELRDTGQYGFVLPPEQIIPTGEENFAAILVLADWARTLVGTTIHLPDGLPESLLADGPTYVNVEIVAVGENLVTGSPTVYFRHSNMESFTALPLTHVDGNLYQATLPASACGNNPEFYFAAEGDVEGTVYDPPSGQFDPYRRPVGVFVELLTDDFETAQGWTPVNLGASSGDWERGVPVGDPTWPYGPTEDGDGSGQCLLTDNGAGNTDVDAGAVAVVSPTLDLSAGNTQISYDYYLRLSNDTGGVDRLVVEIDSNNGNGPWTEIARHDTDGGTTWRHHVIDQTDLDAAGVTLTSTMRIRFIANDATPQSVVEAGVDAFRATTLDCQSPQLCPGDSNCSGVINWRDIDFLVAAQNDNESAWAALFAPEPPPCSYLNNDTNSDGAVNWRDIDPFVALMNTTCP